MARVTAAIQCNGIARATRCVVPNSFLIMPPARCRVPKVRVSDLEEVFICQDQFAPPDARGKLGEWVSDGIKVLGPRMQAVS